MGLKRHKEEQKKSAEMHKEVVVTVKNIKKVIKKVKKSVQKTVPIKAEKIRISKGKNLVKLTIKKAERKAEKNIEHEDARKNKRKENEYKLFSVWLSIPRMILGKTTEEYTEKMGIDDPVYLELLTVKNMTAFAEKYDVAPDTLSNWRKELGAMKDDKEMHEFFNQFTKALLLSFYREQMRRPTPQGIETWYEIIKDRKKNLTLNLEGEIKSSLSDEAKAELKGIISKARRV